MASVAECRVPAGEGVSSRLHRAGAGAGAGRAPVTCDVIPEVPHVGGCQPSTSISAPAGTRAKPAQEAVTAPSEPPSPSASRAARGPSGPNVVILRPESVGADCRPEDSPGQQPCLPEGVEPGQWTSLCESRTCGGTAPAGSLRCSSRDPGGHHRHPSPAPAAGGSPGERSQDGGVPGAWLSRGSRLSPAGRCGSCSPVPPTVLPSRAFPGPGVATLPGSAGVDGQAMMWGWGVRREKPKDSYT